MFNKSFYSVVNDDHLNLYTQLEYLKLLVESKYHFILGIEKLVQDAEIHFNREEWLMKEFGYPGEFNHKVNHLKLLRSIQFYYTSITKGNKPITIKDIEFLELWLTKHIANDDKDLEAFLLFKNVENTNLNPNSFKFTWKNLKLWFKLNFGGKVRFMVGIKTVKKFFIPKKGPTPKEIANGKKHAIHNMFFGNH